MRYRNDVGRRIKQAALLLSRQVKYDNHKPSTASNGPFQDDPAPPLVVATILRGDGITGVDTHIRQLRRYLDQHGTASTLLTPFSWARPLTYPVFGLRPLLLQRCCPPAGVAWYLHWHEVFLRNALRDILAQDDHAVVYAQDPYSARAALRVRRGRYQRVVMAVHFRISMADEWVDKKQIKRDGTVFRKIRQVEREVIPQVDGIVYVSGWGREALLNWLPEAEKVTSTVIGNFVAPLPRVGDQKVLGDLVTIGNLDLVKNHRFLLTVLAQAKAAGSLLTLDVFGDGPCRKDLLQLTHALDLDAQVRFHGFRPDVRDFLPRYRVYVHASYSESLPLAIIEAMAAGLPIVAGDVGGISELCDDGVEARFWPLDNPDKAAAMLIDLLKCESKRLSTASAAAERFRHSFDAEVVGPRLLSFLME